MLVSSTTISWNEESSDFPCLLGRVGSRLGDYNGDVTLAGNF